MGIGGSEMFWTKCARDKVKSELEREVAQLRVYVQSYTNELWTRSRLQEQEIEYLKERTQKMAEELK